MYRLLRVLVGAWVATLGFLAGATLIEKILPLHNPVRWDELFGLFLGVSISVAFFLVALGIAFGRSKEER